MSRSQLIAASRDVLRADAAVEAARVARDLAFAARYRELEPDVGRGRALAAIRAELGEVFTADELRTIGVSDTLIMLAVRRGPARG